MKHLLRLLMVVMFMLVGMHADAATLLAGTLKNPDGTGFNGTLLLSLSQQAGISAAGSCGGPILEVPVVQTQVKFTNGSISNGPISVYGSDCTLPAGIPYNVKAVDNNGNVIFTDQWLITGTTQDLGTVTSVQTGPGGGTVAVTNPIIGNPSGNQVINQPAGTAISINNLTVTGTFIIPAGTTIAANSANTATQFATTPTNCTDINGNHGFQPNDGFVGFAAGIDVFGNALCVQPNFAQLSGTLDSSQLLATVIDTSLGYIPLDPATVGVANGEASLDAGGLVPLSQLPQIPFSQIIGGPDGGGGTTGSFCALAGCTMLGQVTLPNAAQSGLQAASANFVMNQIGPVTVTAGNAYSLALKAVQLISVGAPNGVTPLDVNSLVPTQYLPYASATSDGIITAAEFIAFTTGAGGGGGGGGGGGTVNLPVNAIPYQGGLGTAPVAATAANVAAMYHSIVINAGVTNNNAPCSGVMHADGLCGQLVTSTGMGVNSTGHATSMPEIQTSTDSNGITSFVCQEDHSRGYFDPRCNRVERLDGNNTVVNINTFPALASQQTLNDANCWAQENRRTATVTFPGGFYRVGLPNEPTLTAGSGIVIEGPAAHTLGPPNTGGTVFGSTYNNAGAFHVVGSLTTQCSDGTTVTNSLAGGEVRHILTFGCTEGGCINAPGDSNTYAGGGPGNYGMLVELSQGEGHDLRSAYTGGPGVIAGGLDSQFEDLWSYDALSWYRLDRGVLNGVAYNPGADTIHGGVELRTIDGRFHHVETYGTFIAPHSNGSGASELGHVCGIVVGGGFATASDLFEQVDEMGICAPQDIGHLRISDFRAENNYFNSTYNANDGASWSHGIISSGCNDAASVTLIGHCSDLMDNNTAGSRYSDISVFDFSGFFGASSRTSFIFPGNATFFNVDKANGDGFEHTYAYYLRTNMGVGTSVVSPEVADRDGGAHLTGTAPDVGAPYYHILMSNTTPTSITTLTNALVEQTVYITLASANDVLVARAFGGNFTTCSGQNIVGPYGPVTFTTFANSNVFESIDFHEHCESLPLNFTANTVTSATFQAKPLASPINLTMTSGSTPNGHQYCYAVIAWIGTAATTSSSQCAGQIPPVTTTSVVNVKWNVVLPIGTSEFNVYRISTDDATFSSSFHMGRIYNSGVFTPLPVQTLFTGFDTQTASLDTTTIPLNLNGTGNMFTKRAIPANNAEPCTVGEQVLGANASLFGMYYCDASNKTTMTFHWKFYPLTAGTF